MQIVLYIFLLSLIVILITIVQRYIKFNFDNFFKFQKSKRIRNISERYISSRKKKMTGIASDTKLIPTTKLHELAKKAIKNNNYSQAEEYYILALEKAHASNVPVFLSHLSSLYVKQNNHSKNIECLNKLEKISTLDGNNCLSLALSNLRLGRIAEAKKYITEACLIDPTNTIFLENISEIFIINNEVDKLELFLNKMYEETKSSSILFCLAHAYEKISDKKNLKKVYSRIENNHSDDKNIIKKLKDNLH